MTNEELKLEIISLIRDSKDEWMGKDGEGHSMIYLGKIADALIAAGLRFGENLTATFDHMASEREHELARRLAKAEHRAELAERALFLSAKEIEYLNGNFDSSAEFFAKEKVIPYFMRQAEEELNKESKD